MGESCINYTGSSRGKKYLALDKSFFVLSRFVFKQYERSKDGNSFFLN